MTYPGLPGERTGVNQRESGLISVASRCSFSLRSRDRAAVTEATWLLCSRWESGRFGC